MQAHAVAATAQAAACHVKCSTASLCASLQPCRPPAEAVYAALTSYESLGTFIPGLAENRCLERHEDGCTLLQAGAWAWLGMAGHVAVHCSPLTPTTVLLCHSLHVAPRLRLQLHSCCFPGVTTAGGVLVGWLVDLP